ncbi:MAG: sulfatase-like hydrolase/transferase [Aquihabitans sp.]
MTNQPNILVVLSDQQRPDSCGIYGQELPVTPTLDSMAGRGVTFDQAFTIQPVCGPARASIQTGMVPTEVGCWRNNLALPLGTPTMATRVGDLGYRTGYVGKWHLATDAGSGRGDRPEARYTKRAIPPERRGGYTDGWVASDVLEATSGPTGGHMFGADGERVEMFGYRVDAVTDIVLGEQHKRRESGDERPFLQFVSFLEPHHQNNKLRSIGPAGWADRFRHYEVPADLQGRFGDWRWNYAEYLACCASVDANLARLLDDLEAHGELDDTIVIFSSDHGSHFRTRNFEYKRSCHDASIRIPLVVAGPGFDGGTRDDRLVTHLDFLPTMVAAAGGTIDDTRVTGRPLQEDLANGSWRQAVMVQISESQIGRALRTPTHTFAAAAPNRSPLAAHRRSASDIYVATHLYDNVADPAQSNNLVGDRSTARLRAELARQLAEEIERAEGVRPTVLVG